jgi:hypothetical protein
MLIHEIEITEGVGLHEGRVSIFLDGLSHSS